MYDPDGLDGLDELAFFKKFRRRLKRIRRRVKRIVKKVVKVPFRLVKKVIRPVRKVGRKLNPIKLFKKSRRRSPRDVARRRAAAAANRRASAARVEASNRLRIKSMEAAERMRQASARNEAMKRTSTPSFKTAVPRGAFNNIIRPVGQPTRRPPTETSVLTEPARSPLTRKTGASPLSKSVVVNLSTPRGGGGGGNMYRPMNTPRPSGVNLKTAAMIGIPAVLGLGAVIMMTSRKK